jgi:hypothetical protein
MNQHNYSEETIKLGGELVKCIIEDLPKERLDFIVSYCMPDIQDFYNAVKEAWLK